MPPYDHYVSGSARPYEEIRKILGRPYRNLPAEDLEALLGRANISAEDMENFLQTLGNIGRGVVNALPQVLPAALPVIGTAIGGPLGGAAGAALSGVVGSLIPGQTPPTPTQTATRPAGSTAPAQPAPAPIAPQGTSSAAWQLFTSMFRPETLQALLSMLMGQAGRPTTQVGNTPVPVGAFPNLLGVLANNAAAEYNAIAAANTPATGQHIPRYLESYAGEMHGDPALPEYRAEVLLNLLHEAEPEREPARRAGRRASAQPYYEPAYYEDVPETDEQFYDELELVEFYDQYEFS